MPSLQHIPIVICDSLIIRSIGNFDLGIAQTMSREDIIDIANYSNDTKYYHLNQSRPLSFSSDSCDYTSTSDKFKTYSG